MATKYIVSGVKCGKRKDIRSFEERKFANRFKNLIKVHGKIMPSQKAYRNIRIRKGEKNNGNKS